MAIKSVFALLAPSGAVYASPALLLAEFRADEMAQLSDTSGLVSGETLRSAVNGADLSAEPEGVQAALAASLAVLCHACKRADTDINTALVAAGYTPPVKNARAFLVNLSADISRYYLYDSGTLEDTGIVARRYKTAEKTLESIAKGVLKLGMAETKPTQIGAYMESRPRRFVGARRVWM